VTSTELAGGTYTVRVTAINAVGQSTATSQTQVVAEIDRTTAPDVPTNIVLTGAKGGFKATWAIASDGGRALTESRIRYRISTVADFGTPKVVYTTVRAFTATSLAKGTYSVQIAAVNTKGVSAWTASKSVTVT
jgi:predicted phage tail protein